MERVRVPTKMVLGVILLSSSKLNVNLKFKESHFLGTLANGTEASTRDSVYTFQPGVKNILGSGGPAKRTVTAVIILKMGTFIVEKLRPIWLKISGATIV